MFCVYCHRNNNDFVSLNKTAEYSGIEMSLNRQGMLRVRYYDGVEHNFITEDIIKIKFCPNCGRPMDKSNNNVNTVETIGYADNNVLKSAT